MVNDTNAGEGLTEAEKDAVDDSLALYDTVARIKADAIQQCRTEGRNDAIEAEEMWERALERAVLAERGLAALSDRVADFLLSYSGDGDTSQPWQDGHNYAMREAARMVRERWFEMGTPPFAPHFRGDGLNGETTGCDCPKGADHDL